MEQSEQAALKPRLQTAKGMSVRIST